MDTEYQAPEPENNGLLPDGSMDKEGAMAKADLFKLGKYSYKLFKKIEDDDQLESWVQAKITKAADYLASVYHYMEYEMKFSEYGHKLDNSDVLSESEKSILKNKLVEAHDKIRQLKIVEAKKANEFDDKPIRNLVAKNAKATTSGAGVHADKKKNAKAGITKHKKDVELDETFDPEKFKTAMDKTKIKVDMTGKHADRERDAYDELVASGAKVRQTGADSRATFDTLKPIKRPKKSSEKHLDELSTDAKMGALTGRLDKHTDLVKQAVKSPKKTGAELARSGKNLKRSAGPGSEDDISKLERDAAVLGKSSGRQVQSDQEFKMDARKDKMKGRASDRFKEQDAIKVEEAAPSTGLTKKQKSTTVKAAKSGSDIGKPGKGFETVAKKAATEYGSKEKGEKVAAAAMWKNKVKAVKESIEHEEKYNPYVEQGFENRKDYLNNLADEYGVDVQTVYHLARVLGSSEDFDGLVSAVEDHADSEMHEETTDSSDLRADPTTYGYDPDGESIGKTLAPTQADPSSVQNSIENLKNSLPQLYAKIKADPALNAAIVKDPNVLVTLITGGNVKEGQIDELSTKTYKAVAAKADVAKHDASDAYTNAEYYDKDDEMDTVGRKYKNHKKAASFADRKLAHRDPTFVNESAELSRIRMLSGL